MLVYDDPRGLLLHKSRTGIGGCSLSPTLHGSADDRSLSLSNSAKSRPNCGKSVLGVGAESS